MKYYRVVPIDFDDKIIPYLYEVYRYRFFAKSAAKRMNKFNCMYGGQYIKGYKVVMCRGRLAY